MDRSSSQPDTAARKGAFPRLRNMSTATVRRLSRPLSMVSGRSISPTRERTPNKLKKTSTPNSIASRASRTSRALGPPDSRRTSLLSGRSSVSRDEKEPLGELPVFGVSQRAYLQSLVSLFSNGNGHSTVGSPQSANTPITDPSSGAANLGLYEYDIHSSAIYQYSKVRRLYVGWPGLITPPPEALLEFEMETLPLLERDLQGISGYLGQQGIRITYELRMSGYASATAETVFLSPTVWILYRASSVGGSQVSVAELHQAVSDIFYLQKGLEIQEGGGRIELTSDRGLIDVDLEEKETVQLSDGGKLSIHIENCQEKYSVCGALCCVTVENEEKEQVQSLCRIGGLLKVNGKYILGVTTAHAMLEGSGIFRDSFNESAESRMPQGQAVDRDEILSESRRVSTWHSVSRDAAVDFLGISMNSRGEMAINRSKPENATDFALLRLSKMPGYVRNKYIPPLAQEPVSIISTASASAAAMHEGHVYIICGGGDVAEGQLVWGSACFIIRGRNFRVRRIQTTRPLSAGTTGAWVVRGEVLYGVIIAVYENEPFALMMTVERLFASILGSAFSIRSVELWDGEVPEALLQKVQEQANSSNPPKDTSPAKTRRRTKTETRDHTNGASSSKHAEGINGNGSSSRHMNSSDGTQNLLNHVEDGDQAGEPSADAVADPSQSTRATEELSSPGPSSRRRRQKRSESMASDVSMSGAAHDEQEPPASNGKQRSGTGDSHVSAGTRKINTTVSETLERQDSGFEPAAAPVQSPDRRSPDNEAGGETPRRGLQAPPIRPAEASRNMNLRGGVSPDESSSREVHDDLAEDPDKTPTRSAPPDRRHSYQTVFGKAFGRSLKKAAAPDANHGIPPTGLDGRRPLFSRRRSSAIDPKPGSSRAGSSSNAPNERTSSLTKDSNFGIPPGGLGDRRPLSFIRRLSAQPAAESERPVTDSNRDSTADGPSSSRRSGSIVERPLSFIHRSKGKAPEEPQNTSKKNNFGIPPKGL